MWYVAPQLVIHHSKFHQNPSTLSRDIEFLNFKMAKSVLVLLLLLRQTLLAGHQFSQDTRIKHEIYPRDYRLSKVGMTPVLLVFYSNRYSKPYSTPDGV